MSKKVNYLCWPGGSSTKKGVEIARKLGFKLSTAGKDILNSRKNIPNSPVMKTDRIFRFGPGLYWNGIKGKGSIILYKRGVNLIINLLQFQNRFGMKYFGIIYFKLLRKLLQNYYKIKETLK